ncbi:MAG: metallophosphoesterase [Cyclobacteriaceae bacterium]
MKTYSPLILLIIIILLTSCNSSTKTNSTDESIKLSPDSVELSFIFMGCNRMWWKDTLHSDKSMANINALKRLGDEVAELENKPDLFFFLGDIVSGEATADVLNTQLGQWVDDYNGSTFGGLKSSGIELIAVPGNHEMLDQQEKPLAGTTDIWMKHMRPYMPNNRDSITGSTSAVNQMTYAFRRDNVGFIVMNTDTYNTEDSIGLEGQIPYDWVKGKVAEYYNDDTIDHVFALGHRPFYVNCQRDTSHQGMPTPSKSTPVWESFEASNVAAMLSAHVHQYQRMQPNQKTYQVIAGNGGSPLDHHTPPPFFGYTRVDVWSNGEIKLSSHGYDAPTPYFEPTTSPWSVRDSVDLNWYRQGAQNDSICNTVTGVQ